MTETKSDIDGGWVSGDTPLEPPPDYAAATAERTQPVVPSAPPASAVDHQPHQLDPYPPQPAASTNTTATNYVTVTDTRTRERSCCEDTYCPGFIFCFYVPTPCPGPGLGAGDCCNCLPPTTACCEGGFGITSFGRLFRCGGDGDNPIVIIIMLVVLALILVALIGIIAFYIYRLGDDKPPAIAKRYRVTALVIAIVGYIILIAVGIALAVVYA